jgi:hypothetical protein
LAACTLKILFVEMLQIFENIFLKKKKKTVEENKESSGISEIS